jgi:hypothetical protein
MGPKRTIATIVLLLGLLVAFYTVMLIDTDSLMDEARSILKKEVAAGQTEGRALHRYNDNQDPELSGVEPVDVSLLRVFVIHDFSDGYLVVNYSVHGQDASGKTKSGGSMIPCFWKIHKEDGRWDVVDIYERPYRIGLKEFISYVFDS